MLYQKLLTGEKPYYISIFDMSGFEEHRHPELEINYCLEGSFDIRINQTLYHIEKGDLVIINSMLSHEISQSSNTNPYALIIEIGPSFLRENYNLFAEASFTTLIRVQDTNASILHETLDEIADLYRNPSSFSELLIKGNLYKLCANLLINCIDLNAPAQNSIAMRNVASIEHALELIRTHYFEPITVEQVATLNGYSKSNFCKTFKSITGDTFHNILNRERITNACHLLQNTNNSIEDIAYQVGFNGAKSFCRVFKSITGLTPGTYRKSSN